MIPVSDSSFALAAPVLAFAVAWVVLGLLLSKWSDRILDYPNERSLHHSPVPRTGGVGIIAGLLGSLPFIAPAGWWPLWLGVFIVAAISFADDLLSLPIAARLGVHFAAASLFLVGLSHDGTGLIWILAAIVATAWMTNLFNFMDGMDGLAGGMALFGFAFLGIAAWLGGSIQLALIAASIASSAGAFLLFNFPPARLFLGDMGSTSLGFLAAGIGFIGWRDEVWSLWFPLLVFSPFIVDASATLLWRASQGERFWEAHRTHFYQRLALCGWGHRKTVLAEYGIMVACGLFALAYQNAPDLLRYLIVVLWAVAFLALARGVRAVEQTVDDGAEWNAR